MSFLLTAVSIYAIWSRPEFQMLVDRSTSAIQASIETEIARKVTPELVEKKLHDRLREEKRNWVVIEALRELADERNIILSRILLAEYDLAYEEDHNEWKKVEGCAACLWDTKNCELSPEMICQGVATLSPIGDVTAIIRQGGNYLTGNSVDKTELVLSAAGLGAFVAVPLTAGTSVTIKTGTSLAKVAHRMDLISPKLIRSAKSTILDAMKNRKASDTFWTKLKGKYSKSTRTDSVTPILDTLSSFSRIKESAGLYAALHLTRYVDNSLDARKLARIADVQKQKTVSTLELIGKNRVLRTAMRFSDEIWGFISGIAGMIMAVIGLMFKTIMSLLMSWFRKTVHQNNR